MRTLVIFLGLTTLLGSSFSLQDFRHLLPGEMFIYPRQTLTNIQFTTIVVVVNWILPALAVAAFMWRAKVPNRAQSGIGIKLLTIAAVIFVGQWAVRLLAGLVPGGGGLYAINTLLSYISLPLKIMLLLGAVQLLTNLKPQRVG